MLVPRIMGEQLGFEDTLPQRVNGVVLVIAYLACRIGLCGWMAIRFTLDVAAFSSAYPLEWTCVLVAYFVFLMVIVPYNPHATSSKGHSCRDAPH